MKKLSFNPVVAVISAYLAVLFAFAGCAPSAPVTPVVAATTCEGSYMATVDTPDEATLKASRSWFIRDLGLVPATTGNETTQAEIDAHDATDNATTAAHGAGTPHGGIYLKGWVNWTTGAPAADGSCEITGGEANIFNNPMGVSGRMNDPSKTTAFGFGYDGGPVTGTVANGVITGRLAEGGGRETVHGVVNGKFTPAVK